MAQAPKKPTAPVAKHAKGEKRGHAVLMDLHHDGRAYEPGGDPAFVTVAEFAALKAATVFGGEWADGVEEPDDGQA